MLYTIHAILYYTILYYTIYYILYYIPYNTTPGLHNKIPPRKIFARVWVAQEPICSQVVAKNFQGLGPKRRESCNGDWV